MVNGGVLSVSDANLRTGWVYAGNGNDTCGLVWLSFFTQDYDDLSTSANLP